MKLVYNKKSPDPFYYIQHGYRIGEKVKTVTICKLGRHSELAKIYPNPLEYALSVFLIIPGFRQLSILIMSHN